MLVRSHIWSQISHLAAKMRLAHDTALPNRLLWTTIPLSEETFHTMLSQRLDDMLDNTDSTRDQLPIDSATTSRQRRASWS